MPPNELNTALSQQYLDIVSDLATIRARHEVWHPLLQDLPDTLARMDERVKSVEKMAKSLRMLLVALLIPFLIFAGSQAWEVFLKVKTMPTEMRYNRPVPTGPGP